MGIWDRIEQAGHDLTMVSGLQAGQSPYYCEKCGALVIINFEGILIFHAPPGNPTTEDRCSKPDVQIDPEQSLKTKIKRRDDEDYERLLRI